MYFTSHNSFNTAMTDSRCSSSISNPRSTRKRIIMECWNCTCLLRWFVYQWTDIHVWNLFSPANTLAPLSIKCELSRLISVHFSAYSPSSINFSYSHFIDWQSYIRYWIWIRNDNWTGDYGWSDRNFLYQ